MPNLSEIIANKKIINQKAIELGFEGVSVAKNSDDPTNFNVFIVETSMQSGPEFSGKIKNMEDFLIGIFDDYGIQVEASNILKEVVVTFGQDSSEQYYLDHNVLLEDLTPESFAEVAHTIDQLKLTEAAIVTSVGNYPVGYCGESRKRTYQALEQERELKRVNQGQIKI